MKLSKQLFAAIMFVSASQVYASEYTFTILDSLGGSLSHASDINSSGQVVGWSETAINGTSHATLWSGYSIIDLGTLGGQNSYAFSINDSGQIAGGSLLSVSNNTLHATLWAGGSIIDIGGSSESEAMSINNSGQVGLVIDNHAALWSDGVISYLDPISTASSVSDINNSGQIAGQVNVIMEGGGTAGHAATWVNGVMVDLNSQLPRNSQGGYANAINESGTVVGVSDMSYIHDGVASAASWKNGVWSALDVPGGVYNNYLCSPYCTSGAMAINNKEQVVGYSLFDDYHATLWGGGKSYDLNDFLDFSAIDAGWVLNTAYGINDNGYIVGDASNKILGISRSAFLLSPVPEPLASLMLFVGLSLMGTVLCHRKNH